MRSGLAVAGVAGAILLQGLAFAQSTSPLPAVVLPESDRLRIESAARDRADEACAGAEALDQGQLDALYEDSLTASQLATARLEAAKLQSTLALFRFVGTAGQAAEAAGETEFGGVPLQAYLGGHANAERRLEAAGGAAAIEALVARLRRPGIGVADLDEARATLRQLEIMLPRAYTSLANIHEQGAGDAEAIEELLDAQFPLDPLAGGISLEAADALVDRRTLVESIARLTAELEARTAALAYSSRLDDCLEEIREDAPEAEPPPSAMEACLRHEGRGRAEFFIEATLDVPGLDCQSNPCFDGAIAVDPGVIYENGCLYACLANLGDVGDFGSQFELYGLVAADGSVDARLRLETLETTCRDGRMHRSQLWRFSAPLELLFAGHMVLPGRGETVAEGQGQLFPPSAMPADWAEKFAGARGRWEVVERPAWAQ